MFIVGPWGRGIKLDFFYFLRLPNDKEFSVEMLNLNIPDADEIVKEATQTVILFNSHPAQSMLQWFLKSVIYWPWRKTKKMVTSIFQLIMPKYASPKFCRSKAV